MLFSRQLVLVLLTGVVACRFDTAGFAIDASIGDDDVDADPNAPRQPLDVSVSGAGTGTVVSLPAGIACGAGGVCNGTFVQGSVVSLLPMPEPGSSFAGWSGACSALDACNVTMDGPQTVAATFELGGDTLRAQTYGTPGPDEGLAIDTFADGDVALGGRTGGFINFGGPSVGYLGNGDAFVVRLGADGAHRWTRGLSGNGLEQVSALEVDASGNVVVVGQFQGNIDFGCGNLTAVQTAIFVVRYDGADGDCLWSRKFGGTPDDRGLGVAVSGNELFVTGEFAGTLDPGVGAPLVSLGSADVLVLHLELDDGGSVDAARFGGTKRDTGFDIDVVPGGGVVVAGSFDDKVDFGGGERDGPGKLDIFALRLDAALDWQWDATFGGTGDDVAEAVAVNPVGEVVLAGRYEGDVSIGAPLPAGGASNGFVAKLSGAGVPDWSRGFAGAMADGARRLVIGPGDTVLVTGFFSGAVNFGGGVRTSVGKRDLFVARFSTSGLHLWSSTYGSSAEDVGHGVAVGPAGSSSVYVTGSVGAAVDFGTGPQPYSGQLDVFVLRLRL